MRTLCLIILSVLLARCSSEGQTRAMTQNLNETPTETGSSLLPPTMSETGTGAGAAGTGVHKRNVTGSTSSGDVETEAERRRSFTGATGDQISKGNREKGDISRYDFCGNDNAAITDPDELKTVNAIKAALKAAQIPNCERATLEGVSSLNLSNQGLSDLSPLQGLIGLTELDISGNDLGTNQTDLSELRLMGQLSKLNASSANLASISGLCKSPADQLTELDISENTKITNIGALSACSKLTVFSAKNCNIESMQSILGLTQLRKRNVHMTPGNLLAMKELAAHGPKYIQDHCMHGKVSENGQPTDMATLACSFTPEELGAGAAATGQAGQTAVETVINQFR